MANENNPKEKNRKWSKTLEWTVSTALSRGIQQMSTKSDCNKKYCHVFMTSCVSFLCNDIFALFCHFFPLFSLPLSSFSTMISLCNLIVCWLNHSETIAYHYKIAKQADGTARYVQQTFTTRSRETKQWNTHIKCRKYVNVCEVRWCVKVRYFYELSKHVCYSHFVFVFNEQTETWTECRMASERTQEVRYMCVFIWVICTMVFFYFDTDTNTHARKNWWLQLRKMERNTCEKWPTIKMRTSGKSILCRLPSTFAITNSIYTWIWKFL